MLFLDFFVLYLFFCFVFLLSLASVFFFFRVFFSFFFVIFFCVEKKKKKKKRNEEKPLLQFNKKILPEKKGIT
jgi:hypothetical protein